MRGIVVSTACLGINRRSDREADFIRDEIRVGLQYAGHGPVIPIVVTYRTAGLLMSSSPQHAYLFALITFHLGIKSGPELI